MSVDPLDFRTPADIEHGRRGPNLRLYLLTCATVIGAAIPLAGHPFSWSGVWWALPGALLAILVGHAFLAGQRTRGIPASMVGSTMIMGLFIMPAIGGGIVAMLRISAEFVMTLLQ